MSVDAKDQVGPDVRELQAMAEAAARAPRRRRHGLSRAARLELIDVLSRWASSGLALVAGVAIFVAVSAGQAYPARAAGWALLVLGALYLCRRLQREFRAGEKCSAFPFRWRANYTAALSVLGAAFGAGAVIAVPAAAPHALQFQTLAILLLAGLGASVLHAAHGRSAAAIAAPVLAFAFLGVARMSGLGDAVVWVGAAALTGGAALYFFHRFLRQRARRHFPRTGLNRRALDAEPAAGERGADENATAAARA